MGYTTDFDGQFNLDKPLSEAHRAHLEGFADKRHGSDSGWRADAGKPGLYCQWVPTSDGAAIVWDGGEKFYEYTAWLEYLIDTFLGPWGYTLSGAVTWQGEEPSDMGRLVVKGNRVTEQRAHVEYR